RAVRRRQWKDALPLPIVGLESQRSAIKRRDEPEIVIATDADEADVLAERLFQELKISGQLWFEQRALDIAELSGDGQHLPRATVENRQRPEVRMSVLREHAALAAFESQRDQFRAIAVGVVD